MGYQISRNDFPGHHRTIPSSHLPVRNLKGGSPRNRDAFLREAHARTCAHDDLAGNQWRLLGFSHC